MLWQDKNYLLQEIAKSRPVCVCLHHATTKLAWLQYMLTRTAKNIAFCFRQHVRDHFLLTRTEISYVTVTCIVAYLDCEAR